MMFKIDLNSDLGESFGPWRMGMDREVMEHVSSANVACGFHAGDPEVMIRTVQAAKEASVAVGAHPCTIWRGIILPKNRQFFTTPHRHLGDIRH